MQINKVDEVSEGGGGESGAINPETRKERGGVEKWKEDCKERFLVNGLGDSLKDKSSGQHDERGAGLKTY